MLALIDRFFTIAPNDNRLLSIKNNTHRIDGGYIITKNDENVNLGSSDRD